MKKIKILIIDDFEPLLEEVAEFLTFEGYKTYAAKDGAEGIQMAVEHVPDLIICDIEMPKLNGYQVYKSLEQIPLTASVPVIFLTARAQAEDFRTGLKLGVDDYITKPFELDELLLSINKRLEKHNRLKKHHENKFKALFNSTLTGIFLYSNDKFELLNKKFEEFTGYSKNNFDRDILEKILIGDTK